MPVIISRSSMVVEEFKLEFQVEPNLLGAGPINLPQCITLIPRLISLNSWQVQSVELPEISLYRSRVELSLIKYDVCYILMCSAPGSHEIICRILFT